MLKSYETRVRATYDLLAALLEEINAHPQALLSAVAEAENEVIARGRMSDASKRTVTLTTRLTGDSLPFDYKGVVARYESSDVSGGPVPRYSKAPWDTTISLFRDLAPEITVRQPVGYLVPQEWTSAIDRLGIHGVRFRRFARAWSDSVEQTRVVTWKTQALFEGHRPDSAITVETVHRYRTYRPGDVWVPLDQRSALVAVHLFEAQAPDGLFQWNFFDTIFLKVEGADDYVMEPIARKMMSEDPRLAAEFQAKLAAEPAFAKDPAARLDWFYRRSRWADPEQNLIPVARALHRPPDSVLAPESAAAR